MSCNNASSIDIQAVIPCLSYLNAETKGKSKQWTEAHSPNKQF
jgi:hypothetical protein